MFQAVAAPIVESPAAARPAVARPATRSSPSETTLRLKPDANFNIECDLSGSRFDCRLLFMGDNYRRVMRAYAEAVYCFSHCPDDASLYASLTSCPDIAHFYKVTRRDAGVAIEMRDDVFRQPGPRHSTRLQAIFQNGKSVVSQTLPLERLPVLGQLLPLLAGDYDDSQISRILVQKLSDQDLEWASELLSLLKKSHLLETGARPANSLLRKTETPRVTFMGHTSLLVQSRNSAIVMDPLMMAHVGQPAAFRDVVRLPLRGICCTHGHWDHLDLQTLLWFDKDIPVYVPKLVQATAFNPPMVEALRLLGFTDIREVTHWDPIQIDDIEFIPTPFHGEQDEPGAEIDHYTYVVRTDGMTLYGGVDTYRDTLGEMIPVLERVRDQYHPQIAFLPISKMVYAYEHGGVNGFCRYLDSDLFPQSFQYTASAEDAAGWAQLLGATTVSPYATFAFSKWQMPAEIGRMRRALKARGLGNTFYPLCSLEGYSLADLDDSFRARLRKRMAVALSQARQAIRFVDRKLKRLQMYRLLRKLVVPQTGEAVHHH